MRRRNLIIISATLVAVLFFAAFATAPRNNAAQPFVLSFVTYTNTSAEQCFALFSISNRCARKVVVIPVLPQSQFKGKWPRYIERPWPAQPAQRYVISPHQESSLLIGVNRNVGTWRLPVLWDFEPRAMDFVRAIARDNWAAFRDRRSLPGRAGVGVGKLRTNFTTEIRP